MEKITISEKKPRKRRSKDDFYSLYDLLMDEGAKRVDIRFVTNMFKEGIPPSLMIKLTGLSINRIKEIIKNHIGESVFQTIQAEARKKKSVSDIATEAQVSETIVNRLIELLRYKNPV